MQKSTKKQFKKTTGKKVPFKAKVRSSVTEDTEIKELKSKYDSIVTKNVKTFSDLPVSRKTLRALAEFKFVKPTEIQRQSIGYALQGRDVLGAAVTGSGKTLAFLIPVIENLYLKKWVRQDGLGAIIISPTRELAYQIFETLKKVGKYHDFSAGLIIGGKDLKFERNRMNQCNVIICTPGRLLHHMDQNPLFDCSTLQVLVLDEADRCLDMGFEKDMNAIIENLPPGRQTLLFSATQTKSVKDLARLSLTNPVYVAPNEQQERATPVTLRQNYVVIDLEQKMTMLWSFIKNHTRQKIIVFFSTCKQVKYFTEIFHRLRPPIPVLGLNGGMHQLKRMAVYDEFCRKSSVALFATDVASRGLDFPKVNWVIQLDCPEDAVAYIHRAGRTARNTANGESLLVLLPSEEEAMIEELKQRKIDINKINIDPLKMWSPVAKMQSFLAKENELRQQAERAFISYIRSVVLIKNKNVFKVSELKTDEYAHSLGLAMTPHIKFLRKYQQRQAATMTEETKAAKQKSEENESDDDEGEEESSEESASNGEDDESGDEDTSEDDESEESTDEKCEISTEPKSSNTGFSFEDSSDDDGFLKVKRRDHEIAEEELPEVPSLEEIKANKKEKVITKAALAKKILKKKILPNQKVQFDEEGTEIESLNKLKSELAKEYEESTQSGINIEKARELIREEDKFDKERFKQRVKTKRREKKLKQKNKDDEQKDDFGSDDDEGPDLSWLPAPKDEHDSDEDDEESYPNRRKVANSSDESDSESENDSPTLGAKRRFGNGSDESDSDDEVNAFPVTKKARKIASKLSIDEAEKFAMQLLQK